MPQKDPKARAAYMREYNQKNREQLREGKRRWEERNREQIRERHRKYYLKNRERVLRKQKEREARDPEAYRKYKREAAKQWRLDNPERYRENHRRYHVRTKYGLTLEEYEAILARGCGICGKDQKAAMKRHRRGLCLDHDHANGKVREALCKDCNVGLGSFADDPTLLRVAAKYLEKHR